LRGLVLLVWGIFRQRLWAWWGALISVAMVVSSSTLTFLRLSYSEILETMKIPVGEAERLQRIPLEGRHFAVLVGAPLLITLGKIVVSRKHSGGGGGVGNT